jgi:cytochrome c biogenesis protein CcdA/glutaredoxin
MHNIFHDSGAKLMDDYLQKFDVPEDKQSKTMVFIGDSFLSGQKEIENRLKDEFIKVKDSLMQDILSVSPSSVPALQYFYITGCSSCLEVDRFLDSIHDIDVKKLNISDAENLDLIKMYFKAYEVPEEEQSVPIIFIGDTYLAGEKAIKESLITKIKEGVHLNTPPIEAVEGDQVLEDRLVGYDAFGVLLTGLVNGLNPCSVSMLLFFLSILMARNVSPLKMGFTFIAGKFITYFLLGTLFFNIFAKLNIPWFDKWVKMIMIMVLFVIALFNLRDLFAARREEYDKVKMQLPTFLRKINHQWIKRLTNIQQDKVLMPLSFGLGAIISVGEFLCTGQIYLATIITVLQSGQALDFRAMIYFLIYGAAFVLPLILITVFIHKGREIFDLTEWMRERMPLIKLINAVVFILFGIIIWVWF